MSASMPDVKVMHKRGAKRQLVQSKVQTLLLMFSLSTNDRNGHPFPQDAPRWFADNT